MISKVVEFSEFSLHLIEATTADEVPECSKESGHEYVRIEIPTHRNNIVTMHEKGYAFADRTIGVAINLRNTSIDYQRMVRFETRPAEKDQEQILQIALESFPSDSRFHVRPVTDENVSKEIICNWVENLSNPYVCLHKEQVIGFLDLEAYGVKDRFIHLAAVKERYRAAGAAVSLYANAVLIAKEWGCEKLYGRISSANTAVMNLYARLGGVFSEPIDVFVRDE